MTTTPTSPQVAKFLTENATEIDYCHPQFLEFTSKHTGGRWALFVKANGGLDHAYRVSPNHGFGFGLSTLKALREGVTR